MFRVENETCQNWEYNRIHFRGNEEKRNLYANYTMRYEYIDVKKRLTLHIYRYTQLLAYVSGIKNSGEIM